MKRVLLPVGCIAILTVLTVAYGLSPYLWSTSHIRSDEGSYEPLLMRSLTTVPGNNYAD